MKKTWTCGVDNYRNCTLFIDENTKIFTTSILVKQEEAPVQENAEGGEPAEEEQ